MDGHFTGYSLVHPMSGGTPHDVRVGEAAGQTTLICLTCETFQTVDSIDAGLPILGKVVADGQDT